MQEAPYGEPQVLVVTPGGSPADTVAAIIAQLWPAWTAWAGSARPRLIRRVLRQDWRSSTTTGISRLVFFW